MWEVLRHLSRGRISVRRFSLLFATVLLAFFVATIPAMTAHAEDAQRDGEHVTYQGKTYDSLKDAQGNQTISMPSGLPAGTTGYFYRDDPNGKVYFLLTTGDASQATTAQYVVYDFTPPDNFSNSSPPQTVTIAAASSTNGSSTAQGTTTCDGATLGGIGWIVCPTVKFIAKGMDFIYGVISGFLVVNTVTANTNGPVYKLWSIVRDIANICFVIAFLIIVYSQITSLGINNYGIKKMLPKLIVAAILMNVSYWVCAVAVDASNFLGYAVHSLFTSAFDQLSAGGNFSGDIPTWEQVAGVALAGGGAVAGVIALANIGSIGGAVFLLVPILVGVLLSALVALLVLAARQALLMCLIIISPLAFVAYILPNTEKYFDKWRSTTMTLLVLFPIFSVIFSGAQLAGMAIVQTAGGNLVTIILGMGVQVAPIVITPLLIKFSSGIVGKIAGMINNPNKGLIDRTRNWAKGAAQERKNKILADQNKFKGLNRVNPMAYGGKWTDTYKRRRDGRRKAFESGAENRFDNSRAGMKVRALQGDMANDKKAIENRFASTERGRGIELRSRNLGAEKQEIDNSIARSSAGMRVAHRQALADVDKDRAHTEFERSHYGHDVHHQRGIVEADKIRATAEFDRSAHGRDVDTQKREAERFKQTVHAEHEQHWNVRNLTNAEGSEEREMRLRIATDRSAVGKAKVDATYNELKALDTRSLAINVGSAVADDLAKNAYLTAEEATLTAARSGQAANKLKVEVNNSLMTNGATRQIKDASGNVITTLDDHLIDGVKLQAYATGIGSKETMLANAIAEKRADWAKQAQAAGQLIEHFNLSSAKAQQLAIGGEGVTVPATDSSGNTFLFKADDEYIKEAAIVKQFKEGSASNKKAMIEETSEKVAKRDASGNVVRDASGNIEYRVGYNYEHRTTVADEAMKTGISRLLPYVSDMSIDVIKQGNWTKDGEYIHSIRQILEGRIKVDNLSGANDGALTVLRRLKTLKDNGDPQYQTYKDELLDLYRATMEPADFAIREANFDTDFDANYTGMLDSFRRIVENTNLSRDTSLTSRAVMEETLTENGVHYKKR